MLASHAGDALVTIWLLNVVVSGKLVCIHTVVDLKNHVWLSGTIIA